MHQRVKPGNIDLDNLTAHRHLGVYNKRLTPEQNAEIESMLGERPHTEIARIMGIPVKRISDYMYHQREQRQKELPQSRPKEKYEFAQDLWNDGKTIQEIADAYEYSFKRMCGVIDHYRKKFGWFARRNKKRTIK